MTSIGPPMRSARRSAPLGCPVPAGRALLVTHRPAECAVPHARISGPFPAGCCGKWRWPSSRWWASMPATAILFRALRRHDQARAPRPRARPRPRDRLSGRADLGPRPDRRGRLRRSRSRRCSRTSGSPCLWSRTIWRASMRCATASPRSADGRVVAVGPMAEMLRSPHPWMNAYFQGKRARFGAVPPLAWDRRWKSARYVQIGAFTLAVLWAPASPSSTGSTMPAACASASSIACSSKARFPACSRGSAACFNGIRVGEVINLAPNASDPRQVHAAIAIDRTTPVRAEYGRRHRLPGPDGVARHFARRGNLDVAAHRREGRATPPHCRSGRRSEHDAGRARRAARLDGVLVENAQNNTEI